MITRIDADTIEVTDAVFTHRYERAFLDSQKLAIAAQRDAIIAAKVQELNEVLTLLAQMDDAALPEYDAMAAVKAAAIEANRAECRRRIVERWPEDQQRNAALGILSTEQTDACAAWIKDCRTAENAAADLIDAATDAVGVAAVKVVWP